MGWQNNKSSFSFWIHIEYYVTSNLIQREISRHLIIHQGYIIGAFYYILYANQRLETMQDKNRILFYLLNYSKIAAMSICSQDYIIHMIDEISFCYCVNFFTSLFILKLACCCWCLFCIMGSVMLRIKKVLFESISICTCNHANNIRLYFSLICNSKAY